MVTERSASSAVEERPSILAQLRAWSAKHPLRPAEGRPPALCDPDEIPITWVREPSPERRFWFRQEPRDDDEAAAIERVVAALQRIPKNPDAADASALDALHQAVLGIDRAAYRSLHARLLAQKIRIGQVRSAARWLIRESAHGEAIELAMFLTGASGDREAIADVVILARHFELWPMAIFVLEYFKADTLDLFWARLCHVPCTVRTRIVLRMAPRLKDRPDIRSWILRSGGTDCGLPDVARACAVAGDLAGAIDDPGIDDGLFESSCIIVQSMLGRAIAEYPDGVVAVDRLIRHLGDRCATLHHAYLVQQIGEWLEWPPDAPTFARPVRRGIKASDVETVAATTWEHRRALGWTDEIRARLTDDCQRILRRPHWPALVRAAFGADDAVGETRSPFTQPRNLVAWSVARDVGVDLWEDAFRLLERSPSSGLLLSQVLEIDDPARIERVVRLCERTLPGAIREAAPHGPSTLPRFPLRHQFDALLGAMARHAIPSECLLALALGCGGRTSALAADVLANIPSASWGDEVVAALHAVNGFEPHPNADACLPLLLDRVKQACQD